MNARRQAAYGALTSVAVVGVTILGIIADRARVWRNAIRRAS